MWSSLKLISCLLVASMTLGCSRKTMNARDVRKEQLRINAHKKRMELAPLAGNYRGTMTNVEGSKQDVGIHLEIKDVPETEAGEVDAVLVPTVNASFSLTYGSGTDMQLYSFSTTKADFNGADGKLDLVVSNTQFKDVNLSMHLIGTSLSGTWSSAANSQSGAIELIRVESLSLGGETPSLAGDYKGYFAYDSLQSYQVGFINLVPSVTSGGLNLAASVQMYYGSDHSGEALNYKFEEVEFNSATGSFTLNSEQSDILIKASLASGVITGEWFAKTTGKMGKIHLAKKSSVSPPENHLRLETLKATYRGSLKNTSTSTNLPERIMIGLITTFDPAAPRGLKVTGNVRLYYGPFDSQEFAELPFESIQFDPFRRTVTGKTTGMSHLTVVGSLSSSTKMTGTLSDDSLGQVGTFEVEKYVP